MGMHVKTKNFLYDLVIVLFGSIFASTLVYFIVMYTLQSILRENLVIMLYCISFLLIIALYGFLFWFLTRRAYSDQYNPNSSMKAFLLRFTTAQLIFILPTIFMTADENYPLISGGGLLLYGAYGGMLWLIPIPFVSALLVTALTLPVTALAYHVGRNRFAQRFPDIMQERKLPWLSRGGIALLYAGIFAVFGCAFFRYLQPVEISPDTFFPDEITVTGSPKPEHYEEIVSCYAFDYPSGGNTVKGYAAVPNEVLTGETEKMPLLVVCRGGNGEYGKFTLDSVRQAFASYARMGYIVVASQYPGVAGGTGEDNFGGESDVGSVNDLIDLIKSTGKVDEERIFLYGGSRGGMMACMVARQRDDIAGATIQSGCGDLALNCELRDPSFGEMVARRVGGTPEELPQAYRDRSPRYWADEISCPLLIIHGKKDERVPFACIQPFLDALDEAGHPYETLIYPDGDHFLQPYGQEIIRTMFDFMRKLS